MVFVDTSAWFACFVPADPDHHRVRSWFATCTDPLVTTDYCVDETLTLLLARREPRRALEAGRAFFEHGIAHIYFLTPDQIRSAWTFFLQRIGRY